jgi:hypothetical protein
LRFVELQSGVILTALLFLTSCENLGLDPSGKLACAQGSPKCPTGLSCLAGRCWRPDAFDGAVGAKPTQAFDAQPQDAERATDGSSIDLSVPSGARSNGDNCSSSTNCMSGHCVAATASSSTKVCCDSACEGSCNDGCAGGTCQHEDFRATCGTIENSSYGPRYFLCDGEGNCNPPIFNCGTTSNACAPTSDVTCCGDPVAADGTLNCVASSACFSSGGGGQGCKASIDCPQGTFCCLAENLNVSITGCAVNCGIFTPGGGDPSSFSHAQACDYVRDPTCPASEHCQPPNAFTGVSSCAP